LFELNDRFQNQLYSPIIAIEKTLLNTANGDDFQSDIEQLIKSHYKDDINESDLKRHLLVLPDAIKKQLSLGYMARLWSCMTPMISDV